MSEADSNSFHSWRATGFSGEVLSSATVLQELRDFVIDGYLRLTRGGIEVGGVLFGVREGSRIWVHAWRPIACEHSFGPGFELSQKDVTGFAEMRNLASQDPELVGLEPVLAAAGFAAGSTPLTPGFFSGEIVCAVFTTGLTGGAKYLSTYGVPNRIAPIRVKASNSRPCMPLSLLSPPSGGSLFKSLMSFHLGLPLQIVEFPHRLFRPPAFPAPGRFRPDETDGTAPAAPNPASFRAMPRARQLPGGCIRNR